MDRPALLWRCGVELFGACPYTDVCGSSAVDNTDSWCAGNADGPLHTSHSSLNTYTQTRKHTYEHTIKK